MEYIESNRGTVGIIEIADYYTQIQQFFVGFYGRPADPAGLNFWAEKVGLAGGDFSEALNSFANSEEAQDFVFTNPQTGKPYSNAELIDNIYQNLFNRTTDDAGREYYTGLLKRGEATLGDIVQRVIDGAINEDRTIFDHKVEVALYFTESIEQANADYGSEDILEARSIVSDVSLQESSVEEGKDGADDLVKEM